jgi:uncharacterized protein (DUF433 family)
MKTSIVDINCDMVYDVNIGDIMTRYALNLPQDLKREAEEIASAQGISLNQFIMWSVSEKVASLRQNLDDPNFPGITYRRGASGWVTPVLRGSNIRVQTLITDLDNGLTDQEIAAEYELRAEQIREARAFYNAHSHEIDASIQREQQIETAHGAPKTSP